MKPAAIRWFEILLFAALAVDIGNNLLSSREMAAGMADRGMAISTTALMLLSLVPAIVGFGFWHFIVHRRSSMARWLFALLVAGSAFLFAVQVARFGLSALTPTLSFAGLSELLKLLAAACLLLPGAAPWFADGRRRP